MRDTLASGHCGWKMDFREDVHRDFIESTNEMVRSQDFEKEQNKIAVEKAKINKALDDKSNFGL